MLHHVAHTRLPVPADAAFDWHTRPGAFQRLTPPWQDVRLEHHEGVTDGARAVIRLGVGPASIRWVAEHRDVHSGCRTGDGPCGFTDTQIEGPFAGWTHTHTLAPDGERASVLTDAVEYALPLAPVSDALGGWASRRELDRLFGYRHRVTRADLARHAASHLPPSTVAVTGSTGLIGSALCALLTTGGHRVVRLVRRRDDVAAWSRGDAERAIYWNPDAGEMDLDALAAAAPDAVVHLAGEPVTTTALTVARKRRIWESRTRGTHHLAHALAQLPTPPRVLVSGSASGYYGSRGDQRLTEADAPGDGFFAGVCRAWEAATAPAERAGIRTVHARIGWVLSPAGGPLRTIGRAVQAGAGAWPGDGRAWWAWIALDDALYAILHMLATDRLRGPVNVSAPQPATARDTVSTLARVLRRPAWGGLPERWLRLAGGEAAVELALPSLRMLPDRLAHTGFHWSYPDLEGALRHLYGRPLPPPS